MFKAEGEKAEREHNFAFPFLRNRLTYDVITVQPKAWMTGPHFAMWLELVVKPLLQLDPPGSLPKPYPPKFKRIVLYVDNHTSRSVSMVKEILRTMPNLHLRFLPPNMTDKLQPMDLIVNGTLKTRMRSHRVDALFDPFQDWVTNKKINPNYPAWETFVPTPTAFDSLQAIEAACSHFKTKEFQEGLRNAFKHAGLAPTRLSFDGTPVYKEYVSHDGEPGSFEVHISEALTMADIISCYAAYEWTDDCLPTGPGGDEMDV